MSLPQGFKTLSSLQSLSIERCNEFDLENSEDEWKGLINLDSLTLRSIPKLTTLTRRFGNLICLRELRIYDCPGLTHLPETIDKLKSLRTLVISECKSMDSLPKGMINITSLHNLEITDCPLLLPRCQPETGDDWPQIAQIKNKLVRETPQDLRDLL
jgi:leucine-rich repeat protein SHOC2